MKTLFVGGPEDGKRNDWDWHIHGPIIKMATYTALNGPVVPLDEATIGMDIHTYRLQRFMGDGKTHEIAVHSSIQNPMEALIKGYHYHRNPRYGRTRRIPRIP